MPKQTTTPVSLHKHCQSNYNAAASDSGCYFGKMLFRLSTFLDGEALLFILIKLEDL